MILEAFRPGTEPARHSREDESGLSFARNSVSEDPMSQLAAEAEDGPGEDDEEDDLGGLY